jgi:CheY-like chemotaxis protein
LGLAVARGVVRAHNGAINVVSTQGSGTTFQVLLLGIPNDEISNREHSTNSSRVADDFPAATVLVIEDDESLRVSVSKILRKRGFFVIEAGDGNAALDLFRPRAARIDVVLLDLTLPGKSGRALLYEIQRIRPDVKVVVTSAYPREHVHNSLDGLQFWSYIQKPYQVIELEKELRKCSAETFRIADTPN